MEPRNLVFIGRFQPFHNGHYAVLAKALSRADNVLVLVGSATNPRTTKNPWTYAEREVMIQACFPEAVRDNRLRIRPLRDRLYNEALWVADTQRQVAEVLGTESIGIIGQDKDSSSYYLHAFPQWVFTDTLTTTALSATEIRDYLYAGGAGGLAMARASLPEAVAAMVSAFTDSATFAELRKEHEFLVSYKKSWAAAPYPPVFVTVDAVVVHSGHVLLVKRRAAPGKGLWALPGGFLNASEDTLTGCLRELREETKLKIPVPVLKGSLKATRVFDHPDRSLRGRTITHAFHFDFPVGELPSVRGADDAEKARWVPVAEALDMSTRLFEDHTHILEYFLNRG